MGKTTVRVMMNNIVDNRHQVRFAGFKLDLRLLFGMIVLALVLSGSAFAQTAPVVAGIPDQTIAEGSTFATINLDDYVTDAEEPDSLIGWSFSGNSELSVSIVNRVVTITIPSLDWFGTEMITFSATDTTALAGSDSATFTVTAVNDAPVVSDILDQTIAEGSTFATINLDNFVADIDDADSTINWTFSGNTELSVSIVNRIATITIPNIDWFGAETITFTATDPDLLTNSDPATFTVTNVNDAPVVSDIPDQSVTEGAGFASINLDNFVTDIDNLASEISWSYSGNTELTVSIVNRVATITIPSLDWFGAETITFTATDAGLLADSNAATFTVTAVNDAPIVSDIPDQTIAEGSTLATINLDNFVADIDDADSTISWSFSGNTELSVSIVNRIATITTPSLDWNGNETITFTATDPGLLADSNAATFTVTAVNDAPVVSDIPDQTITEGALFATVDLDSYVSDIDNLALEMNWSYTGNTELTVSIDINRVATITAPSLDWNGSETIAFTATDPGLLFDADAALFTVTAVNDAPVVANIPDQTIAEGSTFATINLDNYVADIDNADSTISWTYSGNTALTVAIVNHVATITIPDINWNGAETITFTATDVGALADSNAATFTVNAVNDAPVVSGIADETIAEGGSFTAINLNNFVTDIDNAIGELTWSYSGNVQLNVSIVNNVAIVATPNANWNGSEAISFTATDPGLLAGSDIAQFTVTGVNDAPVVANIPNQTIPEGSSFATINLDDYVSDIDNLDSDMSWSYLGNTELTVTIVNRVATIGIPSSSWNGSETITFTATDPGLLNSSDPATFTVTAVNNAPVVSDIPDQTINEGSTFATINLDDYVTDIDNADSTISWTYSGNTELTVAIVNRVATVTAPDADWNGSELVTFTAEDPSLLANSNAATFTVTAVNDAPVVSDIPNQTIAEGATFATINLDSYVSDIDNLASEMNWSYSGNAELTVSIDANRIATITIPNINWFGNETISFTATDPGLLTDSDPATFTVTNVNDAPVMTAIPNQTVAEGLPFATINLDNYISDIDNLDSEISWSYSGNLALTVSITNRVATISTPNADWNGTETITFTGTDPGLLFDEQSATFAVTAENDAPVVAGIPNQTVPEGSSFVTVNLDNYVTDVDNTDAEMTWTYAGNVELGVSIVNRLAIISIPTAEWNGAETITFTATDPGLLSDGDDAIFTVTAVNDLPVVSNIPGQTIAEGALFTTINLDSYVSDLDNLPSEMTWTWEGNVALTVSIDANRVATISAPNADWFGSESITFTATDPGLLADSDPATFTITAVNDAPQVADIPDQIIDEGSLFAVINLDSYVSDVDNIDSDMNWSYSGTTELTVSIDVNRVATITIPSANWSGAETITFTATDPGLLFSSDAAAFTVNAVNDAPVVTDIPNQTISEGSSFATINLDNYVSDVDNLDSDMSWSFSGNIALSVAIVNRVATITMPSADWYGAETITFTATDPGLLSDSDPATFTVTNVNDVPIVSDIPNQTISEGGSFTTIALDDYVTDIDNLDASLNWTYSGNTELIVSINVNRIATITTPSPTWNGAETITFTATDPGLLADANAATFTVTSSDDPPIVTDIPNQTVAEGSSFATINLDNYVSDVDNLDSEISWSYSGNTQLTVSIDANRVATITPPNADWNGSELITFTASDPTLLSNSDQATFTVTPINDAPVVSDIPDQTITEGSTFATINLDAYVSDVDNSDAEITWGFTGNINLSVSIVNRVAIITTPGPNWFGAEVVTFSATDPGLLNASNAAQFTVTAVNDAPVVANIPNQTITEGQLFATIPLDSYVSDVDNLPSELTWTVEGNTALTVTLDVNRVATIGIPSADWNGSEILSFTATDPGGESDIDNAIFTVTAVNDAPVVSDIPDQTVTEGSTFATINLDNYVTDVDNSDSQMNWTYSGNTQLTISIVNRIATITIPSSSWNGAETITFTASDPGLLTDSDPALFTVSAVNNAPVVSNIPDQTIAEGGTFATINLDDFVADIDNLDTEMSWTYSGNTQLGVSIDINRVATITTPSADWNGSEIITFTATDPGLLADSDPAVFTVTAVNDAPIVSNIPDQTIAEGGTFATINLDSFVSDVDNADNQISWSYSGNTELTVSINVNRVATISTPGPNWNGSELITFTATDPGLLTSADAAQFTVTSTNDAPIVTDIPNQTILEGLSFTTINLDSYVSDADNLDNELTWSYIGNTDLIVTIDSNRIATITVPNINWNGSEAITFTATDPSLLSNSDIATFTVSPINDAPVVSDIPNQTVVEGTSFTAINLDSYITDVDNVPADMVWNYAGNIQLSVSIVNRVAIVTTPNADWNGSENITFTATDPGGLSSFNAALFTVTAVNDAPVVSVIANQTINEGSPFATISLDSHVSDADNLASEMSWSWVGNTQLTVSLDVNRVATIGIPNADWNGNETITFTATDPGGLFDGATATFTVTAVNDRPVVTDIPDQTINEGATFATILLDNYVSDIDNLDADMTWTYSGNSALTVSILNRVATITIPDINWNGAETITFTATDPGLLADSNAATFTVNAVNDAPVVSDIPDQTVLEGSTFATINLDDYVADVDDADAVINWTFSGNTELTVAIVNRVATITIPTIDWNGTETISFTATDPGLLFASDPAAFTVTAVGDAPILAAIGAQSTTENVNLSFGVTAADADGTTPVLTAVGLPSGASFNDNLNGTGSFNWTPTFVQAGVYNVTFIADDGLLADSEIVAITVIEAGNQTPVLAAIGPRSTTENINLNLGISATDLDQTTPTLTVVGLPLGASFIDNSNGTGSFDWTPTFVQAGVYNVTFIASDGLAADSEIVAITVNEAGNQPPVLAPIGAQATLEDANLTFGVSAADVDATIPTLSAVGLPTGATFNDNLNGTGTFNWTPDFTQSGSYNVTFIASDGALADSELVAITVNETGNQAPVLAAIGAQAVTEGGNLNFNISATDADATTPTLTASGLPLNATFNDNGNGTGTFDLNPDYLQSGVYNVTFVASDGLVADSEIVAITVNDAGNQLPILAAIGAQSVTEGGNLNFGVSATDIEATLITLTTTTLPLNATFNDNGDGTGTFNFDPSYIQAGVYNVTFYATDDSAAVDSELVVITVNEAGNQAPVLAPIGPQATLEDVNLTFGVSAADVDATIPTLSAIGLPTGATFNDNLDGTGTFNWMPDFTQSGSYNVTFIASDGALADSELVAITVNETGNQAPVLATIGARLTTENVNLTFGISATDLDATIPALSAVGLPTGASFNDNLNGTGTFNWTPTFVQAGVYNVTFIASDGLLADSEMVAITVNEAGNQTPVLAAIGARSTTENINLAFGLTASDLDETIPTFSVVNLPTGANFTDNGNGTASFNWTPNFIQAGVYNVTFIGSDGLAADSEIVTITVNEVGNQTPVQAAIGNKSTGENVNLSFTVTAVDADSTFPAMTAVGLPTGALYTDNGDGTALFDWTPTFIQAGAYNVTFIASDGIAADSETIVINVLESGNQAPTIVTIGAQSITENINLNFVVTAFDVDSTIPALIALNVPATASFTAHGDGTGTFDWTPSFIESGVYNVTFIATDGLRSDTEVVAITVIEAGNQTPVLAVIGAQSTTENINLKFNISASDVDATIPALSAVGLPTGVSFNDNGTGTGSFDWTPTYIQAGLYNVTFIASDGLLADSEIVAITVIEAGNQAPVLATIGAQATTEDVNLNFVISATDVDTTTPALSAVGLPTGATFNDHLDGTGTFDWTPSFIQAGVYNVTFIADDGLLADSEIVAITVNETGNQAPVLAAIGAQATDENLNLTFGLSALDLDATIPALLVVDLPTGANFTDNGDGTASFDWTPDFFQAGLYNVTFITDDGTLADSEIVVITVNNINRPPVADAGLDQINHPAGQLVTLDGSQSSDPDLETLNYHWAQIAGTPITLSDTTIDMPTFLPTVPDSYLFELTVDDGDLTSAPDTVQIDVVNGAPPLPVTDLTISINGQNIELAWSEITSDTVGFLVPIDRYVVYRGTMAFFTPTSADSIGAADGATFAFTDADLSGANVVGDPNNQYFYVVEVVDIYGNRSDISNRVGEYDYPLVTTATTDFNLVAIPFNNTGITDAVSLITAIGTGNVLTVNNYLPASQSFESRFAAGFGPNFAVSTGRVYQVNAAANSVFSVAGDVPDSGTISYNLITTATTDFGFIMIPFEYENDFSTAQDVINSAPGMFNTLNNFVAGSQSYESRFAAGFGTNFTVRAGKPYQANVATGGTFPQ